MVISLKIMGFTRIIKFIGIYLHMVFSYSFRIPSASIVMATLAMLYIHVYFLIFLWEMRNQNGCVLPIPQCIWWGAGE